MAIVHAPHPCGNACNVYTTARQTLGLFVTLAVALAACGPPQPTGGPNGDARLETIPPELAERGQLQVFVTSQLTDGRNIMLRGLVRNPYPEKVDGVRVIFRVLSVPGADARELDRVQRVLDDHLESAAQTAIRLDLQTMYAGQSGMSGFTLEAFAIKRGGQDVPPPPGWKQ